VVLKTVAAPVSRAPDAKSKYQILYWQDLPSELKVWDDHEEVKVSLPTRFAERIDAQAQKLGLTKGDDYLAQLRWETKSNAPAHPPMSPLP